MYDREHAGHPPAASLLNASTTLTVTAEGSIRPRPGIDPSHLTRTSVGALPAGTYYASAVQKVCEDIVTALNDRGYIGVAVVPHPEDIDESGQDQRPEDRTTMRLQVRTGIIETVRTLGSGERIAVEERINHPRHAKFRDRSPVHEGDLIRKDLLDEYIFRMNRQPGRRVDVAVSAGEAPGTIALDYLITENKPWLAYFEVSNTGTKDTEEWRETFGLFHNQLTGRDDILSLEFVTGGFDETNAFIASYDAPILDSEYWRWRVFGTWSEFTAADLAAPGADFTGDQWSLGGEVSVNVWQEQEAFIDLYGGFRYQDVTVDNEASGIEGDEEFFIPYGGARFLRRSDTEQTLASLSLEAGFADGDSGDELDALGRTNVDDDWVAARWSFSHSFYLEPFLNRAAWEDPNTPESSTLAHEIYMSLRGMHSFGARLIPQEQERAGGFYSVRGYEESAVAGDTVILGTVEYRFHLPRVLPIPTTAEERRASRIDDLFGAPFRITPQGVYGQPDWDLIFRVFLDVGRTLNADREVFEQNETLIGTGFGVEFQFRRNFNARVDWGFALEDAGAVTDGSSRVHIGVTLLY